MNIFEKLFANTEIPELYPVKFSLPCGQIHREQIDGIIRKELQNGDLASRIKPGMSVAITAGSREITDIDQIVRTVVDFVKECKGEPFVFPAMGSHGGATAEGQLEVLAGYGITEETMAAPFILPWRPCIFPIPQAAFPFILILTRQRQTLSFLSAASNRIQISTGNMRAAL